MSNLNVNTKVEQLVPDTDEAQHNMIQSCEYYEYLKNVKRSEVIDEEDFSNIFMYL